MITDRTELERALKAWPSRNLEQLVEELSHLGARWKAGEPVRVPRISLVLRSGLVMSGVVLDLHRDRSGTRTLLLRSLGAQPHLPAELDVAHVPWTSIEAVTVHDVASLGLPPDPAPGDALTRGELERRASALKEVLAHRVGTPIDLVFEATDDDALEPLGWLLGMVEQVLLELLGHEPFANAMRGRVRRLKLGVGLHAHLVFADGVLAINTPAEWNERATPEALTRELEALL